VLAALALNVGQVVPVRVLVDAVWAAPPASASKQVMNAVSRLRRALGEAGAPDLIATVARGYRLEADICEVDAREFETRVAAAGKAASKGGTAEAARLLRSALGLWRGPALTGLTGGSHELTAAAWEERRVAAQEMCCECEIALGRCREILGELAELVAGNPLREKPAGLYMLALYRCGRQADALAVYAVTRELLAEQMGLDPGPELRGLHQQILAADPALASAGTLALSLGGAADLIPAVPQIRHSLPADTLAFAGRSAELNQIAALAGDMADGHGVVVVGAIDGMPGVGKTALAVHAAHALAARFPDRQLFIDLRAHTAEHEPVKAEDALADLLASVGVDPRYLPGDLHGRAAMWRDRMAGQKALLVLDNAATSDQVAPLLPGSGGCLVLVTSRRHLGDLPGAVSPVLLNVLTPVEATQMFTRLAPRAAGDHAGVAEVIGLAGFLPLAISLLARVFVRHPSWSLTDLAAETRGAVMTMAAENDSVAAAFELSYRHLAPAAQHLFRLLGMHPGPTFDSYASAALAGIGSQEAARLLDCLQREGLVIEAGYRRYGMHDLLSRYARDLAEADATASGGQQAAARLLDYYQHAAALADARLARHSRPGPSPSAHAGVEIPELTDAGRAAAWMRADRASLLACLDLATRTGQHARVVALTAGLAAVLRRDGPWVEAIARHTIAFDAGRHIGDQSGEANALLELAIVRRLTDDYAGAAQAGEQAHGIFRDLGDRLGVANTLLEVGIVRRLADDYMGAVEVVEQALGIFRELGDGLGVANALREVAIVRMMTADYLSATQALEQALGICRDIGDRFGEANTLTKLGMMRRQAGDYAGAASLGHDSLSIYRQLGDRLGQANALHEMGALRRTSGDLLGAAEVVEESLSIYRDLGDRLGEANALHNLGVVLRLRGEYLNAAGVVEQSLGIYRLLGSRLGEANALQELGVMRRLAGDPVGAAGTLEESLAIYRDLCDPDGEAETLNELGTLHRAQGDLARAQECHTQALDLARPMGSLRGEAIALAGLARCAVAAGVAREAELLLRQAHQIFKRIGAAETQEVLAELDTIAVRSP
jgi:DNA-binding SARP family transcriptional activator/tetratricopeptide (TPR) repeat protein